ncbi:MAG: TraB/GumN family protein [Bacteroidaceae bacterium]|nr:TraB/GumN family protein [Bacteroidaceae bacterium]
MKSTFFAALLGCAFISVSVCAKTKVSNSTAKNPGWLWEISGNGLTQKSYLFGTCHGDEHIFTTEEIHSITGLDNALKEVKVVLFEGGLNAEGAKEYNDTLKTLSIEIYKQITNPSPKWMMPEGTNYHQLLDSTAFREVDEYLSNKMKDAEYWKKKPNYWISRYFIQSLFKPNGLSVDELLYQEVQKQGINVGSVESYASVFEPLASMITEFTNADIDTVSVSLEEQADMLYKYIHYGENEDSLTNIKKRLAAVYLLNDTCKMESLLGESGDVVGMEKNDPMKKRIAYDRNVIWIPVIKENIIKQPSMIAVGCRHLMGSESLIAMLRREGYTIKAITK